MLLSLHKRSHRQDSSAQNHAAGKMSLLTDVSRTQRTNFKKGQELCLQLRFTQSESDLKGEQRRVQPLEKPPKKKKEKETDLRYRKQKVRGRRDGGLKGDHKVLSQHGVPAEQGTLTGRSDSRRLKYLLKTSLNCDYGVDSPHLWPGNCHQKRASPFSKLMCC